jgi:hypothetical protein
VRFSCHFWSQRNSFKAVIYFPLILMIHKDKQRMEKIAGVEVLRIINEPTAASLAYGLDKNKTKLF